MGTRWIPVDTKSRVCDSCTEAVTSEAADYGMDPDQVDAEDFSEILGGDIPDHTCDWARSMRPTDTYYSTPSEAAQYQPGWRNCTCACQPS